MSKKEEITIPTDEKRKGYKKTKLGWIPNDWNIIQLEEVGKTVTGLTYKPNMIHEKGVLVLRSSNVKNRTLKFTDNVYVNVEEGEYNKTKKGDILICVRNGSRNLIGKNAIIDNASKGTAFGAFMLIFRSQDYNYLYQLFDTPYYEREIHRNLGATINSINTNNLKKFKFPFPKKEERLAITKHLIFWDARISKLSKLITSKKLLKKALMQQLLSGKKRLPEFDTQWLVNRFDYFLNYSPRPVQKPNTAFIKLGIRSHCKGTFQNLDFKPEDIAIDTLYLVKPKDLIVNITFAWEGAVAIVKNKDEGALVSHRFPTYTFKDGISDTEYFKQFIQSKRFRYLLELISPGGAGRNRVLSKKELNKLKIKVPPFNEQIAISKILNTADQEIELLEKQLKQLNKQKKGLMQQLLTGKKRLKF